MGDFYIPVGIESIETNIFPDVALYLKSGKNFVLYKSHGRDFSEKDTERLKDNNVEFLYVSPGDQEIINEFMESNAERLLKDETLGNKTKGKIIYQTTINFVGDIFDNPDKVCDFGRSKRLIENILLYLSNDKQAFSSLESVMSHNYFTFVHSLQVTALSLLLHSEAYIHKSENTRMKGINSLKKKQHSMTYPFLLSVTTMNGTTATDFHLGLRGLKSREVHKLGQSATSIALSQSIGIAKKHYHHTWPYKL